MTVGAVADNAAVLEDRNVTIAEASAILGVPKWRLYRLAREGGKDWPQRIWPVDAVRSAGCRGLLAQYRLSEVANALADEHADIEARHAARRSVRNTTP